MIFQTPQLLAVPLDFFVSEVVFDFAFKSLFEVGCRYGVVEVVMVGGIEAGPNATVRVVVGVVL